MSLEGEMKGTASPPAIASFSPPPAAATEHHTIATAGSMRLNNFDLIRLLAACQVVYSHGTSYLHVAGGPLDSLIGFLPGVPIFFVVSGFLISLSWERTPSAMQFARNRALRIYPALWVCLAVSIAIFLACGVRPDSATSLIVWIAAQLTFVQFYNPAFLRGFGLGAINGSLWTIPVELQFYALLPFLAIAAKKRRPVWLGYALAAAVVMMLARTFYFQRITTVQKLFGVTIVPYLFYFLVGVVLRKQFERRPELFRGKGLAWMATYAAWAAMEMRFAIPGSQGNLLNIPSIILLASATVSLAFTLPALSSRLLRGNDVSYGLYIYHGPILNLLLYRQHYGIRGFAELLMLTFTAAIISWLFVERPALELKNYSLRPVV
jgi:peptidoglycan/LPS O-acetylase OafA/YrhL